MNDGAIWAGRGVTLAAQTGFAARVRWFSLVVAPEAFWSQNTAFGLQAPVGAAQHPLADPMRPFQIDLPQRFGTKAYSRLDPGQSTLRADVAGFAAGISTANQAWGPATTFPLILGDNAPGFPHGFVGTSRPWNLWIGKAHGRLVWGRLEQTPYTGIPADSAARFMAGMVGSFTPRGVPGLELGFARFFHTPWPHGGLRPAHLLKPFETFAKLDFDSQGREVFDAVATNQLASVYFRWVLPHSGMEAYGEFAREDNNQNLRDFLLEPDHNSGYMLGLRSAWALDSGRMLGVRGEVLNAARSHLFRARRQEPFYVHSVTRQGHTERGQILGSPAAYDGAGSTLALDLYDPRGRVTASWTRLFRQDEVDLAQPDSVLPSPLDVTHALGVNALLFAGRFDVTAGVTGVYEFNRYEAGNAFNLNVVLGLRAPL